MFAAHDQHDRFVERLALAREKMITDHLAARGLRDERVLAAFLGVPREAFVPPHLASVAYADRALPIGLGQTISQPYIVAVTLNALALRGGERVLEIGTGTGYSAALLAELAGEVYTVERLRDLADKARARLERLGYGRVHVGCGDGTLGWPEHAPYDAIAVAASGPRLPRGLVDQLAPGGRLVMPVHFEEHDEALVLVERSADGSLSERRLEDVRFVPLIGREGVHLSGAPAAPEREDEEA